MSPKKQAPITFTSALNYVDKVKVWHGTITSNFPNADLLFSKKRFASQPYKSFLAILQGYERGSTPLQDVYAQVTQLLSSAPDLVEDFQQLLPAPAAAHAEAQAAAAGSS